MVGIDWKRFPKELAPSSARDKTKRKGGASSTLKPNLLSSKKKSKTLTIHPDDVLDKLEKAEKNGAKEGGDGNEGSDADGVYFLFLTASHMYKKRFCSCWIKLQKLLNSNEICFAW